MHPQHEVRIFGRVARALGEPASRGLELAVHALMNLTDPIERSLPFGIGAERQRQHRVNGVIQTADGGPRRGPETAVIVNAGSHQRMRELQEDGAAPAEQNDALGVDPARD